MKKLLYICLFFCIYANFIANAQSTLPVNKTLPNTYTLNFSASGNVSAGVYSNGILVRTLFAQEHFEAGPHTLQWDGLDDKGNLLTIGTTYQVKILENNITNTWDGIIGNTSLSDTGATVHYYYGTISGMVEVGNYMYGLATFSERDHQGLFKVLKSAPNVKINVVPGINTGMSGYFICANSTNVYYGGRDYNQGTNFIWATAVSNDAEVAFSAGTVVNISPMRIFNHAIDANTLGATGRITGMAVQQGGSKYLLVAHALQNKIDVLNGATGALIRTDAITSPDNLNLENDNTLWVSNGTTENKYTVNSDGTLTATGSIISGFTHIMGADVYAGKLSVLDQQVVKQYNTTTLASISTIGTVGVDYSTSPTVTNTKFYFNDTRGYLPVFITHQSDSSLWIGDVGNWRYQHFDKTGSYINNIMTQPRLYNVNTVMNQPTQVFQNLAEYTIDYSQPLASGWALTNNYGYAFPAGWGGTQPVTRILLASNGKRYALVQQDSNHPYYVELTSTGFRLINSVLPSGSQIDSTGSVYYRTATGSYPTRVLNYNKLRLTGFDGSNNPTFASATTAASMVLGTDVASGNSNWAISNSGILGLYGSSNATGPSKLFHISGYDIANSRFKFKTLYETFIAYKGLFPKPQFFDIGNSVQQPGNDVNSIQNWYIFGYHGEFWKNSQTSIITVTNDEGLVLTQFGFLGPQVTNMDAPYGYANNSQTLRPVQVASKIEIYTNEESAHGGFHRWTLDNLSSVNEQTTNVKLTNRVLPIIPNQIDLLSALVAGQSPQGKPGWTVSPAEYFTNSGDQFKSTVGSAVCCELGRSPDVIMLGSHAGAGSHYYVQVSTPLITACSQWQVSGLIDLSRLAFNSVVGTSNDQYHIDILDNNNKIIATLKPFRNFTLGFNGVSNGPYNHSNFVGSTGYGYNKFVIAKYNSTSVYINIDLYGTQLTSVQPIFDGTANLNYPKYIRMSFDWGSSSYGVQLGINELKIAYQ
jgi:hypothetical protein